MHLFYCVLKDKDLLKPSKLFLYTHQVLSECLGILLKEMVEKVDI